MEITTKNPGALAGAHRADVTVPPGNNDIETDTATAIDLQVRRILARYVVSLPVALLIAQNAFSSGRPA